MSLRPRRLRSRLVLAMVGTSIATLVAATLTLLGLGLLGASIRRRKKA